MGFFKRFPYLCEGSVLKDKKENNTAYPGNIPEKGSKVLKKFRTLSCIMTIMNLQTIMKAI